MSKRAVFLDRDGVLMADTNYVGHVERVVVLDNSPWIGGQIWRGEEAHPGDALARRWRQRFAQSGARALHQATAFAALSPQVLRADTPGGGLEVTWRKLVLATGAREQFVPFPGWTLPGVLGPGGLHAMAKAGWPVGGQRVVVAGTGPLLLAVAAGLKTHGARVRLVAEQATWAKVLSFGAGLWRHPGKLAQGARVKAHLLGVPYRCGCWPVRAEGTDRVRSVTLTDGAHTWTEACEALACGFHLVPNVELARLLGCATPAGAVRVNELQETTVPGVFCAGEPTGVGGADCALVEGEIAGLAAAGRAESARAWFDRRASWHQFRADLTAAFALRPELRQLADADTIVCRCEDVRHGALAGFADGRSAKLQTRCGMGACQGRTCGPATRFLFGWDTASARPPVFSVRVGALVGARPQSHTNVTSTKPQT